METQQNSKPQKKWYKKIKYWILIALVAFIGIIVLALVSSKGMPMLKDVPKEVFYEVIKDEFTIEEKVHQILHHLLEVQSVRISELFGKAKNKIEIIVTFLAILELAKMKEIIARQSELFQEIEIVRNKNNIIPYERRDQTGAV